MLAEVQGRIDVLHDMFVETVAEGRGMSIEDVEAVADGRVFIAKEAQKIGLIDGVQSTEDTFRAMVDRNKSADHAARTARINQRLRHA